MSQSDGRVLLVGGTGFLGSHVAARLAADGRSFAVFARAGSNLAVLPPRTEVRAGNLEDADSFARAASDVDTVVFCVSMGFGQVPALVRALDKPPREKRGGRNGEGAGGGVPKRALFVSTTAIFTRLPVASRPVRLQAEEAVRNSGLAWTILRPTMIYGTGRDRNVSRLLRLLRRWPVFPLVGDGSALQQPVHVQDLADGLLAALDTPATIGRAYDLGGPEPVALREMVATAGRAVGRDVRFVRVPVRLALAGARLLAPLHLRVLPTPEQVLRLGEDKAVEIASAAADFGFRPRTFAEGVAEEAASLGLRPRAAPLTGVGSR